MYRNVADIMRANKAAGRHFFDKDTIAFFNSKIEPEIIGGRYFVDSSQFCPSDGDCFPRRYSVCVADERGNVTHVSRPGAFPNKDRALAAARIYAKTGWLGIANHCAYCGKELPAGRNVTRCADCLESALNR